MLSLRVPFTLATPLLVLCVSIPVAKADPVIVSYHVHIQSCSAYDNTLNPTVGLTCGTYPTSFPLTVTFDSSVTTTTTGDSFEHRFGPPSFSSVPLPAPDVPNPTSFFKETVLRGSLNLRNAAIVSSQGTIVGAYFLTQEIVLVGEDSGSARAPSIANLISLATFFTFSTQAAIEDEEVGALFYRGIAIPDTASAPVPEPATLFLFGAGAIALARKAWKRRTRYSEC